MSGVSMIWDCEVIPTVALITSFSVKQTVRALSKG
jgi:hypothetical protein